VCAAYCPMPEKICLVVLPSFIVLFYRTSQVPVLSGLETKVFGVH
jgi:hypothetical protein